MQSETPVCPTPDFSDPSQHCCGNCCNFVLPTQWDPRGCCRVSGELADEADTCPQWDIPASR